MAATVTAVDPTVVPRRASKLTIEEFGKCNRAAQLDGTLYGSSAGFLGGLFGYRFLKLNKNVSLFGGLLTGVVSGYVITQQALITRIARAEADAEAAQRKRDEEKGGKYDMNRGESGFGGMEAFEDKYATTSGEH